MGTGGTSAPALAAAGTGEAGAEALMAAGTSSTFTAGSAGVASGAFGCSVAGGAETGGAAEAVVVATAGAPAEALVEEAWAAFPSAIDIAGEPDSDVMAGSSGDRPVSSNWMWGLPISVNDFMSRRDRITPSARGGSRPGDTTAFAMSTTTFVEPSRL